MHAQPITWLLHVDDAERLSLLTHTTTVTTLTRASHVVEQHIHSFQPPKKKKKKKNTLYHNVLYLTCSISILSKDQGLLLTSVIRHAGRGT